MNRKQKICRLCMSTNVKLTEIFNEKSEIAHEIFLITGVVMLDLNLSKALICSKCLSDLKIAMKLRNTSRTSDEFFRNLMAKCESDIFAVELTFLKQITGSKQDIKTESVISEEDIKNESIFCEPSYPSSVEDFEEKEIKLEVIEKVTEKVERKKKFQCDGCDQIFSYKTPLLRHIKKNHRKSRKKVIKKGTTLTQKNYICPTCAKVFHTSSNLSQHEKTHRIVAPNEYYFCDLCGNKFKEKCLMWIHIKNRHIKKISYDCTLCNKSYTTNYHLRKHMSIIHYNIKEFKCEYCPKAFGKKHYLINHVRIHTGEQPFQCKFCDRKFTHQTDCRRHQWNHTGHKRFICQNCNQGFMKRAELQSHSNRCNGSF